jgi:hypothetical protein
MTPMFIPKPPRPPLADRVSPNPAEVDFPLLRAAVARCGVRLRRRNRADDALDHATAAKAPAAVLRWHRRNFAAAVLAHEEARAAARALYASELLPAILGGEWTARGGLTLPHPSPRVRVKGPLLDHPVTLRRPGFRGRLTWQIGAIIGQPYGLFDDAGTVNPDALELARMFGDRGVAVWARPDLGEWFPGATSLVLVARGLDPAQAERFGFAVLAPGFVQ